MSDLSSFSSSNEQHDPDIIAYLCAARNVDKNEINEGAEKIILHDRNRSRRVSFSCKSSEFYGSLAHSAQSPQQSSENLADVLIQVNAIAVDLNDPTISRKGLICGRNRSADIYIPPKYRRVGNEQFSITFDDNLYLVIRDLGSQRGTSVTYGHGNTYRRTNYDWIVGGTTLLDNLSGPITIKIPDYIEFVLRVEHYDPKESRFRDQVAFFLNQNSTGEEQLPICSTETTAVLTNASSSRSQTPFTGQLIDKRVVAGGRFFIVQYVSTSRECWVEKTPSRGEIEEADWNELWEQEVKLLSLIKHEHIVRFLGLKTATGPVLRFEWMPNGTLQSHLEERRYFSNAECMQVTTQACSALKYLHQHKTAHGHIGLSGFLVKSRNDNRIVVKLADFPVSREAIILRSKQRTVKYCAPELFLQDNQCFTGAADIWALGVVLAEMTRGIPFAYENSLDHGGWCQQLVADLNRTNSPSENICSKFVRNYLLKIDARRRMSAQEALQRLHSGLGKL